MHASSLRLLTLFALTLLTAGGLRPARAEHPRSPSTAPVQRVAATGAVVCNCANSTRELDLCHASSVSVTIGGETLKVPTGQDPADCTTWSVPAGKCVAFRYRFRCFRQGLMSGWRCYLERAAVQCRTALPGDRCDEDPRRATEVLERHSLVPRVTAGAAAPGAGQSSPM